MITPLELLQDAQELLRVVPHEGRRRTVISRAYYAAFHFVRSHPCCDEFTRNRSTGMHRDLLNYLETSPEPNVQYAADLLQSLYVQRIAADYQLGYDILRNAPAACVEQATYIIEETLVEYDSARDVR